jgi:hypothetical protein
LDVAVPVHWNAFLAVRAHQESFDERYETNNNCQVCSLGGSLVCCTFCNLVYHPTCIPAMQAHILVTGFVCVKCFGDTFPAQKKLYKRVLFDLECPLPASPWPTIACSDTIAAQSAGADLRSAQAASTVAVDAGAHTTLVAPADAAAKGNVGESAVGAAARHGGADDFIARVDSLADPIVADAPLRAAEVLNQSGARGGVRTRARVRADSHVANRTMLSHQSLLSSPVRSRHSTRLHRQGHKPALFRPLALAAHSHDDSERLLDQAILRAQQEGKSFPYTVLTSFGESPLPMD